MADQANDSPEAGKERALPEGFILKTVNTDCSGQKYDVEAPQAESLEAILAAYTKLGKNGEEILLAIWNAGNEQGAKQGQKNLVRTAIAADEGVDDAIAKHQSVARQFIQGAPRGGGGARHESGLTKKQREALGSAVATEMARTGGAPSKARMDEIATELGIDPTQLHQA